MGSKDSDDGSVVSPRHGDDMGDASSASEYTSYEQQQHHHQASAAAPMGDELSTPPDATTLTQQHHDDGAMFSLHTPPTSSSPMRGSSSSSSIAHDHVHFAMLQSESPKPNPHFVSVTTCSNAPPSALSFETNRKDLDLLSPSSAPGDSNRDHHDDGSFHRPGRFFNASSDRQYAASSPGGGRLHRLNGLGKNSLTFVSQKSIPRDSAHDLARQALSHRKISVGDVTFDNPRDSNVRESVRRVHAYSRREVPLDYELTASVRFKRRSCQLTMDRETLEWKRRNRTIGQIDTDDIVAAHPLTTGKPKNGAAAPTLAFRVHFFKKGKGNLEKQLNRKHQTLDFLCDSADIVEKWVHTIQELVRWQARAPPIAEKRKIKVVVNPHSGKRKACKIWHEKVKQFFEWGFFDVVLEETSYSGHAIDMGRQFSAEDGFEALVFIGGDGTLCEFMNGLLSRPEHEWREIVVATPISLISAGTQNAFGMGVGIATVEAAVYCIIKRKLRPLDVITAVSEHDPEKVHFSYCGVGWGVAGDIAAESEKYRWMGTSRYAYLKLLRTLIKPKRHTGRVKYVLTDPQPPLRKYFDIRDEGALDQFEMEAGNVYDHGDQAVAGESQQQRDSMGSVASSSGGHGAGAGAGTGLPRKSWGGSGGAIRSPASHKRYPEPMWVEETGQYFVVGVVNAAPDGAFAHPSDGNLDLIISRKGNFFSMLHLGILYLFGKELESPLIDYKKVKAVVIEQNEPANGMNNDGEVLPGPGPWRMEVVPSLFKALSEK